MTKAIISENLLESFASLFLHESSRLEIETPTGDPLMYDGKQVAVNLHGPATPEFVAAKDAMEKEATRRVFAAMGGKKKKGEQEDKEADQKFLCAVTSSFENFPFPGGKEAIYRERKLQYIAEQVRKHLNDLGNFFGDASKS